MSAAHHTTLPVFFTHGYFLHEDPKEQVIMKPYPPLGLLYISAWLDRHHVENEIFDTTFSHKNLLFERLLLTKPGIVALYTNLMTKLNVLEIMHFVRQQPDLAHTLILLGGPDVTHNTFDYLQAGADLIVLGEGEQTMLEVALTLQANPAWSSTEMPTLFGHIEGLAMLTPEQIVYKTPPRTKLKSLEELPLPNRHKIDLQQYLDAWKRVHGHAAISLSTQRGCPYTCRWCSTAVYGQSYRRRSPQSVVEEIVDLQAHYNFDLIWFVDDVFTVSHKWLSEFADALQEQQVTIQFECITRADRLTDEVLSVLKDAGCFRVWIGAESGSQRIIDAMDRRVDVMQVRAMIQSARRTGIQAGTFIMLGYPGETEADIFETVEHLKQANPDLFTITVAYPIKGTGLYEEVAATTHSLLPWAQRTDRDLDFKRTYPRRYYDFAVRWTVNSVHLFKLQTNKTPFSKKTAKLWIKVQAARAGMWWSKRI
jgi:anaerobic magnesium-protoporphyrin IX monomethyl ester cyclase